MEQRTSCEKAHAQAEYIFRALLPENGLVVREAQIALCHEMLPDPISEAEKKEYPSLRDYIQTVVVPDMQRKLRQGFGRAIRTETDTCVVAILDQRAARGQRYHKAVLEALPECRTTGSMEQVARFIQRCKNQEYFL